MPRLPLAACLTALALLLLPLRAASYDDDDLDYAVKGFSGDGRQVLYEESFSQGHVGGGHVKLVLFSARSGARLRAVTIAAETGDDDPGGARELVREAVGRRRARALKARLRLVPGRPLGEGGAGPTVRLTEEGPAPSLPEYADQLKGQSRRVTRVLSLARGGREVALRRWVVQQAPSVNSHTGMPYWPAMSLGEGGRLSPDGQTLALVLKTGDADADTAPLVLHLPLVARRLNARGMARLRRGVRGGAESLFADAHAVFPGHRHAGFNLACMAAQRGDAARAVPLLEEHRRHWPAGFVRRVKGDRDFYRIREEPRFKALITPGE